MSNDRWLNVALKEARFGRHKQHRMGAVIVRGGSVLSRAANQSKPFGLTNRGRHAEERALTPTRDFSGAKLYVAREGSRMSRPCRSCMRLIIKAGIDRIVYLDWNGLAVEERI